MDNEQVEMADVLRVLERDYPEVFKVCVQSVIITNLTNKLNQLSALPEDSHPPLANGLPNLPNVPSFVPE